MRNRLFFSFTIILCLILLAFTLSETSLGKDDEWNNPSSKIGLIDLSQIKTEAPHFIQLRKEAEEYRRELEEFTAQVLSEHLQSVKGLMVNEKGLAEKQENLTQQKTSYLRSQELAAEAQRKIDQKRQELERIQQEKEKAVMGEFHAVLEKVAKKKKLECILLKDGFYIGGNDITKDVLKTWEKWGLTFWQRAKLFFTGKANQPAQVKKANSDREKE